MSEEKKPDPKRVTIEIPPDLAAKHERLMHDTLTTAIEGGINYWAKGRSFERLKDLTYVSCEIRPDPSEGLPYPDGDPRNGWQRVDAARIEAAMLRIIQEKICAAHIREWVTKDYLDPDTCAGDADSADAVIQIALFGEIVFG